MLLESHFESQDSIRIHFNVRIFYNTCSFSGSLVHCVRQSYGEDLKIALPEHCFTQPWIRESMWFYHTILIWTISKNSVRRICENEKTLMTRLFAQHGVDPCCRRHDSHSGCRRQMRSHSAKTVKLKYDSLTSVYGKGAETNLNQTTNG